MKCLSIFLVTIILATSCLAKAKPLVSIGADFPIPIPSVADSPRIPFPTETGTSKADSSKEVETMDKAESLYYGYYPYYYGSWPYYGYHHPLVYVGK